MTEHGSRARWGTAGLVAPAAAALFAGMSSWALQHPPVTPTVAVGKPAPTAGAPAAADRQLSALRHRLALQQRQLVALQRRVTQVRAHARALESAAAKISRQPPPTFNVAPGPVYLPGPGVASAPQPPTAPPATQATTRASGARP